jgi:hypothetical protein
MANEKHVLNDIIDKLKSIGEEKDKIIKELTEENNKMTSLSFNNSSTGKNGGRMASSYEINELISENGEKVFWKRFKTMIKSSKYVFLIKTSFRNEKITL